MGKIPFKLNIKVIMKLNFQILVINMIEELCVAIAYFVIAVHYLHLAIG